MQVNQDIEGFYRAFNLTQRVYDQHWTGEGTSNTMPRVSWLGSTNNKTPSSRFLEDGSYVRLKNVQIGYSFSQGTMSRWRMKGLRIYVTGENLLTFTKYTGLDPEIGIQNANATQNGVDNGAYPSSRFFTFGLNVTF